MDTGPLRGHLDPDAESLLPAGLEALLDLEPMAPLRAVPGRETFLWPQAEGAALVVKRHAVDLARDRWYDRLHGQGGRSPGRREFDNLAALGAAGLPVPRPLGWAEDGAGRSLVVMARVPHAETLRELAARDAGARRRCLQALVRLVTGLHERGWYHRDLYLQHVVVAARGELVLLDVGRARRERHPRRRWFVKDLAALLHSVPAAVPPATRMRFLAAYLDARGIGGRGPRRRWARAVGSRARRMAAHVPRHDPPEQEP